ncbi:MFS transporter [Cohnella zeiphila]|uniref:MFS transporter n=1 Tax=Cohnella zeiphila TaxID=2761120 RepID=A0A7X0VZF6_9BACL|nr:MFS transporter [Cohnella zeiphila]MBB6735981.1 MFS transporter [Cohnella zeiphila]
MNFVPVQTKAEVPRQSAGKWLVLAALMAAQFMIVIDLAGVNVALPSIQRDLRFSETSLQWVSGIYQLIFGSFLLLGGRIADRQGRSRMFRIGVILFSGASLLCGLAWSSGSLLAFRGVQGMAAALLSPTALSTVMRLFPEGRDRHIALGVWGAVFGAGGALGSLFGGIITSAWGWNWFFFLNVPLGLYALLAGARLLPRDVPGEAKGKFDAPGAIAVSAGTIVLLYGLTTAPNAGWTAPVTLASFAAAALLLASFVRIQARSPSPLIPKPLIRMPTLRAGLGIGVWIGVCHFSMFFVLTQYMQNVLGLTAIQTAGGYMAAAALTILFANLTSRLVKPFGVKSILIAGQICVTLAFAYFSRLPADGHYAVDLLPALLVCGIGWGLLFPSVNLLSFTGLEKMNTGIASGLVNMSEQFGGAAGTTVSAVVAAAWAGASASSSSAAGLLADGSSLASGFRAAFLMLTGLSIVCLVLTALFVRPPRSANAQAMPKMSH